MNYLTELRTILTLKYFYYIAPNALALFAVFELNF